MKRILSVILAFVLIMAAAIPVYAVDEAEKQVAVVVPGVMETMLYFEESLALNLRFFDGAGDYIRDFGNLKDLLFGTLKALFLFKYDTLDKALEGLCDAAIGPLAMDPAGTSARSLVPIATEAVDCSLAALRESGKWERVDQGVKIALSLAEQIGDENVYVFLYDWRQNPADLAELLDSFITDVKELSGADKVDLYTNSYGAQVAATYLYDLNGCANVDHAVFNAPAWQGTSVCRLLTAGSREEMLFNMTDGLHFVMQLFMLDFDLEPLVRLIPKRIADEVFFTLARRTLTEHMLYIPAFWCCAATDDYDALKEELLDPARDADFIAKNDAIQYGIMRRIPEILDHIQANGVTPAITACDGNRLFIGGEINGDYVVDVANATGGEAMPLGERFADGRTGDYISPSGGLDLTNGLLPDRTWVISGQAHGQTYWDGVTNTLIPRLLFTDEIENVFSSPDYPQFLDSRCPAMDISLVPGNGPEKTLYPAAGKAELVIRNESDAPVILSGVTVCGLPYKAGPVAGILKPGGSKVVTLEPTGEPAETGYGSVKVCYADTGLFPQTESRTFAFRVG